MKNLIKFHYLWTAVLILEVLIPAIIYNSYTSALPFLLAAFLVLFLKPLRLKKSSKNLDKIYDERAKLMHYKAAAYTMYGLFFLIFLFYGVELAKEGTISFRTNVELLGGVLIWICSGIYVKRKY